MDSEKINAEVISVSPDKVKIMIYNMDNWKTAEDKLKVGSYLEIKDENLTEKVLMEEGEKILSNIKPLDFVVTMEIKGTQFSSEDFASKIEELTNDGIQEIVFVIGSSCGIGKNVSERANLKMSMSKMTFLHQFARLILVEQIYRAFKIIKGETYHK